MTGIDNEQDLMEEHLAVKAETEAKAKAERDAQHEFEAMHWRAQDDNRRFDQYKARVPMLEKIANFARNHSQVKTNDWSVELGDHGNIYIGGVDTTYAVSFDVEYVKSRSYSRVADMPTNKIRIKTHGTRTNHGRSTTQYPQHKDGGHNYEGVANDLVWFASTKIEELRRQRAFEKNKSAVPEVLEALELKEYHYGVMRFSPSSNNEMHPVLVTFEGKVAMSAEKAIKVAKFLREMGIKV